MTHIIVQDAQVYTDNTKLAIASLDADLESSVVTEIFAVLSSAYNTSIWLDVSTTPKLVKKVLAMTYVGYYFKRTYSEEDLPSSYGNQLLDDAARIAAGIVNGSLTLIDAVAPATNTSQPSFFPNDASSILQPTPNDRSLGGARFSMNKVF